MASMSTASNLPFPACSFFTNNQTRRFPPPPPPQLATIKTNHLLRRRLSCKANHLDRQEYNDDHFGDHYSHEMMMKLDRRNMLIALGGGLYGAAATGTPHAKGLPIQAPDISQCELADGGGKPINCCPPYKSGTKIIDFKLPSHNSPLRVRPAAHLVNKEYLNKYRRAVKLMRELPASDPRNFMQQANVHCAYCDGAYDQVGFPDLELQVHNSWLFFPWHRYYLYFNERILGKLIGDETFALPYWNWDAPAGMRMPSIYTTPSTSLYDPLRDAKHQPPTLIDLDYNLIDQNLPEKEQIDQNLTIMYRQVAANKTPELFLGAAYRRGDQPNPGAGSLENVPHGPVHLWTGDRTQPNFEDMGTFYSAGRDPIFFAHHGNIDRLWYIWQTKVAAKNNNGFKDKDWLDAAFLFYDENAQLVRVRVRDCLDNKLLRYTYQEVDIPWLTKRPTPKATQAAARSAFTEATFPLTLTAAASTTVRRPRVSRSEAEKAAETEVLVVDGIQFPGDKAIKFDVYINAPEFAEIGPSASEFAGSFVNVPHLHVARETAVMTTRLKLSITEALDELGLDGDENIIITVVPRAGSENLKIGGLSIDFSSSSSA
ncbi:polyphenol oxidase protein [Dioscorea alata]|uniref:Polyphenol oxidase protein n=1 Tax=Dioscorea alata TaxID=55571 RepID=A0ACB7TUN8_DIOAL|nr:polyphenol oxidase protein [Dioscorea alata]